MHHGAASFAAYRAESYDDWYATPKGSRIARAEDALLGQLLASFQGVHSALDIGCGTGHFTRWLASQGLEATGLDPSAAMLAVARERSPGIHYLQGTAEALPFADRSFDLAAFVTSLEFVADQERALLEAARVAHRGLLLGVLNLASPLGVYRKALSRFRPSRYRHARFFTPWGLERWARRLLVDWMERVTVRTTVWPRIMPLGASRLPFGAFIGAVVVFKDES